jgi:uncharacterized membrane protein YwaF
LKGYAVSTQFLYINIKIYPFSDLFLISFPPIIIHIIFQLVIYNYTYITVLYFYSNNKEFFSICKPDLQISLTSSFSLTLFHAMFSWIDQIKNSCKKQNMKYKMW